MLDENKLFILNLTLTLRCTLNCKLCVADVPKYKKLPHFEMDYLIDSMDRCFEIVDYAERFQMSGGEPLIHKDIHKIVEHAMNYKDKFSMLGIFSNGTIVPSQELIDVINKYKESVDFKFYISHYGEHSNKVDEVSKVLGDNQIPYEVKIYHGENQHFDGWVDYGNYENQDYSEEKLKDLFKNCGVHQMGGIWSLRFGELHRCTRSASGTSLGKIPKIEGDYLDFFNDDSADTRRQKLHELMNKDYISACKHCTGDFGTVDKSKRFPAAQQQIRP